jgi:hypothetical protein
MHNVSIEALVERRVSRPIMARKKGGGARPPLSRRRSWCARLTDADPTEQLSGKGAGTRPPAFEESIMTATYTFHIFSSLDGFGSHNGNWAATWASKAPRCWLTASPCTIRSSG